MTIEEAKQELKDYIYNKKWIEGRLEDIEERRTILYKITSTFSDMPKGKSIVQDRQAESSAKILDLTNELKNYLQDFKKKQIKIESKIDMLPQPYKNILYFRYIRGYSLTEVSDEIEAEYDYTRKLQGIALLKYAHIE